MPNASTVLLVFFVCFNVFAGIMGAFGVDSQLGLSTEVGGDEDRKDLENQSDNVPTGGGIVDTLYGVYNLVTGYFNQLFGFLMPGFTMLENAGVPNEITNGLKTITGILIAIDLARIAVGRVA